MGSLQKIVLEEVKTLIKEAVRINFGGQQFLLKVDVNEDPNKKGIKIQFLPVEFGTMSKTEQDDIAMDLERKLEEGLSQIGLRVERDRNLKDRSIIGFFIYLEYFDRIVRQVLRKAEEDNSSNEPR